MSSLPPDAPGSAGATVSVAPPRAYPSDYAITAIQTLLVDQVTVEVAAALAQAGIRSLLLKGPSFSELFYDNGAVRPYDDSDLLVSPDDFAAAKEVMRQLGFIDDLGFLEHPRMESEAGFPWVRGAQQVDLHCTIWGVGVDSRVAWEELSAGAEPITVANAEIETLSAPGRALHVALHAAQHGEMAVRPRVDLQYALARLPFELWEQAADLAARVNATGAFATGLRLMPAGEDLVEALGLSEAISPDAALRITPVPLAQGFRELAHTPGARAKVSIALRELVPTPEFMRWWSPLARRGRAGLLTSYLWRPVWLGWRAIPGLLAWRRAESGRLRAPGSERNRARPAKVPQAPGGAPLSVLITAPWAERLGGAEEMLCTFLEHVDSERIDPHVVLFSDGPLVDTLRAQGIPTTVIEAGRIRQVHRTIRTVLELARLLRSQRPDLILNWTTKTHYYGALAAFLARQHTKVMWWQHGIPRGSWLDRYAAALPAVAIGCSSNAAAAAQRRVAVNRRVFVVHPGIRKEVQRAKKDRASVREQLGIVNGTQVIGIVGRLQPWKGQHLFLHALSALREQGRDVHGLIVGGDAYNLSPEYSLEIAQLIRSLGLEDRVTLTGQVDDATSFIEAMDVLVCASAGEPFGIVLLEAMRAGIPVVSTAAGGPSEIVHHEQSGLLVGERSPAALAAALAKLLDHPEVSAEMGVVGKSLVQQRFTAQVMTDRLVNSLTAASMRHHHL